MLTEHDAVALSVGRKIKLLTHVHASIRDVDAQYLHFVKLHEDQRLSAEQDFILQRALSYSAKASQVSSSK